MNAGHPFDATDGIAPAMAAGVAHHIWTVQELIENANSN